jgi:hypothetical protein
LEAGLRLLARMGLKVPTRHEPIKTLYFTHLGISKSLDPDLAVSKLLDFVYRSKLHRSYQMVSFPDWWKLGARSRALKFAIYQTVDVGIYSIAVAGHDLVETSKEQSFNFEMAVI